MLDVLRRAQTRSQGTHIYSGLQICLVQGLASIVPEGPISSIGMPWNSTRNMPEALHHELSSTEVTVGALFVARVWCSVE